MRPIIARRPSPALLIALLALTVALGGTSHAADAVSAAVAKVTGKQIKRNAITARHIKKGAVRSSDVKNGSLLAKDFKTGQLPPEGPVGPQGAPGPPGPQGPEGPAGLQGMAGAAVAWASVHLGKAGLVDGPHQGIDSVTLEDFGAVCVRLVSTVDVAQHVAVVGPVRVWHNGNFQALSHPVLVPNTATVDWGCPANSFVVQIFETDLTIMDSGDVYGFTIAVL